jgi:hypothetical protein
MSVCTTVCPYVCVCVCSVFWQRWKNSFSPSESEKHGKCGQKCPAPQPAGHKNTGREPHSHTSLLTNPQVRQPITVSDVHVCSTVCRKRRRKSVSSCSANVISRPRPLFMSTNGHTALPLRRGESPTKISISRREMFFRSVDNMTSGRR